MTTKELAQLTVPQRIALAEELWDSVSESIEQSKVTESEVGYVEARLKEISSRKEGLVNWKVLKANARNKKK